MPPTSIPTRWARIPQTQTTYRSTLEHHWSKTAAKGEESTTHTDEVSPAALQSAAEVEALTRYIQALEKIRQEQPSAYFFGPTIGGPLTELFSRLKRRQHALASQGSLLPATIARLGALGQGLDRYTTVPVSLLNPFFWLQMPLSLVFGGKELQDKARTIYRDQLADKEKDQDLLPSTIRERLEKKSQMRKQSNDNDPNLEKDQAEGQEPKKVKVKPPRDLIAALREQLKEKEVEPLTEKEKRLAFMRGERPDFALAAKALGDTMVNRLSAAEIDAYARALADRARLAATETVKKKAPVQYYLNPFVSGPLSRSSLAMLERINRNTALDPRRQGTQFITSLLPAGVLAGAGLYSALSGSGPNYLTGKDVDPLVDPLILLALYQTLRGVDAGMYALDFRKDPTKARQREQVLSTLYDEALRKQS